MYSRSGPPLLSSAQSSIPRRGLGATPSTAGPGVSLRGGGGGGGGGRSGGAARAAVSFAAVPAAAAPPSASSPAPSAAAGSAPRPAPSLSRAPQLALSPAEAERCRDAFVALDGGTGELQLRHVRVALQRLGLYPSEESLFATVSAVDPEGKGVLPLRQFSQLVAALAAVCSAGAPMDTSTIDAFVALGGNRDQTGVISTEKLRDVVINEFRLPINIDKLIDEADSDASGFIDFDEFTQMLKAKGTRQ